MTKLTPGKTVIRETAVMERGVPVVAVLHPKYIEIRLKGKRTGVTVDYEAVLDLGRKIAYRRSGGKL